MSLFRFPLVLTALGGGIFLSGCGKSDSPDTPRETLPVITVATALVESAEIVPRQELPGTVQAAQRATISAKALGTVTTVAFVIGQEVRAGDLLLTLSAEELDARVAQARAALDLATREYQRESDLLRQGATAQETVNRLADNRRMAAANLDQVKAQLAYTQITAPFDGLITARHVEPGDLASPGLPLLSIEGRGAFEVAVAVPDSLPLARLADAITIKLGGQNLVAKVSESSPAADPASRTRLVVLSLPPETQVRSGQYVRVQWPVARRQQLTVPSAAITRFGQIDRVFVIADNRAVLRLVRIGGQHEDRTVVLAGLNPGEKVVLRPPAALRDGQPVNPQP